MSVYWRPVYWSLRLDWSVSPEEAKDLTQEYFSVFLERSMIQRVREEWGRFRAYVKTTLKRFMLDRRRAAGRIKRTVERTIVALEDLPAVEQDRAASDAPPDRRFERELMRSILSLALDDLRRSCEKNGRSVHFQVFQAYYVDQAEGGTLTYQDLSERFGLGQHEVKNRLAELRARFRRSVLGYLRDGLSSEQELVAEIREVFEA
ncbi:MAG: sigma-70 family RNA polymerase sigma factor [Planctomycetes bacterium]|nr:sigma-70 family RNA polymerase sigma factor [Planctomycetota bacterium]